MSGQRQATARRAEPVSVQPQVLAARQAESSLQAVSPVLRLAVLQAAWGAHRPVALHQAHGAQDVPRRARDVRDAQQAALALTEP